MSVSRLPSHLTSLESLSLSKTHSQTIQNYTHHLLAEVNLSFNFLYFAMQKLAHISCTMFSHDHTLISKATVSRCFDSKAFVTTNNIDKRR